MRNCPSCQASLAEKDVKAGKCPKCGKPLAGPGVPPADVGKATVDDIGKTLDIGLGKATVDESQIGKTVDASAAGQTPAAPDDKGHATVDERHLRATVDLSNLPRGGKTVGGSGEQATFDSADLSRADEERMNQLWGDAVQPGMRPGMTIKGRESVTSDTESNLKIQQRTLRTATDCKTSEADYELLEMLGQGGMGVVYTARQACINRTVALKMIKSQAASDATQRAKFLSEAVVTGELDHPNIVPIYDLGANEHGALFYSMKRVEGTPWHKVIADKSLPENLEILMKVADAIAFAHSRGVIHRDLKPENIMLGDYGEVLVMDWGLALPTAEFGKHDSVYASAGLGGTPAYMAPEMASGRGDEITIRSDVYLLGAILYEIVVGHPPHTGQSTMTCLFNAAKNEIAPTTKTGELVDVALRAMATNPADRYQSVGDLQNAIRGYLAHSESIALTARAEDDLAGAGKSDDYQDYSRAMFAFEEALAMWEGNVRARRGIATARLAYAESADRKGDYDLGLSLLNARDAAHAALHARMLAAKRERDARQQRLKALKRMLAAGMAVFLVVVSGAAVWINSERNEAVRQEKIAKAEKKAAEEAREEEERQRLLAENAERAAKKAAELERIAKVAAEKAEKLAKEAEAAERAAKVEANQKRIEADNARIAAEKARKEADDARKAEEYEAYVALIGLAAAKIDENAFGTARELLQSCRQRLPHLLNWEWGRLMHICTQHFEEFDPKVRVEAVAFSPDGRRFIAGGWNGLARVWDPQAGKTIDLPHTDAAGGELFVHAVAFSPDGRRVATGANDHRIRIWNLETRKVERTLSGHTDSVLSVKFSRDGRRILSGSYDGTARLWDLTKDEPPRKFVGHTWWVWDVAFSPDETRIVTASQDGTAMVWSLAEEKPKPGAPFTGHRGPVYAAAFSPDGQYIVTGGYDKRVLLWRPDEVLPRDYQKLAYGEPVPSPKYVALDGHKAAVRSVAFSQDGSQIISGSHDNTVNLWHVGSARLIKSLRGHDSWVRSCAFSKDQRYVLSGGYDRTNQVRLWDISGYEEVRILRGRVLRGHNDSIFAVAFSREGDRIVTASRDRTAKTFDFRTGRELQSFEEGHAYLASRAIFFDGNKRLVTSAIDNTVRVWEVSSGTQVQQFAGTGQNAAVAAAHDTPQGHPGWLVTGSDAKNLDGNLGVKSSELKSRGGKDRRIAERQSAKVWHVARKEPLKELTGHRAAVSAVAVSRNNALVFTGDERGRGKVWKSGEWRELYSFDLPSQRKITAAAFLPDGSRLLTASLDNTVAQWDMRSGREVESLLLKHPRGVVALALYPSGQRAVTSCDDGKVRIWDVQGARLVGELPVDVGKGRVDAIDISPDSRIAVTVNTLQGAVQLWNLETRQEIPAITKKERKGHFLDFRTLGGTVWSAAFSSDGKNVVTVGGDTARLWDAQIDAPIARQAERDLMSFSPHGPVAAADFSPDGKYVVTGSWDNSARLWDAASGKALRKFEHGHDSYVNSAVFSPDAAGVFVLTASDDGTAVLWDAKTGKDVRHFRGHTDRVRSAVFSAKGDFILTASYDATARIWNARTGELVQTFAHNKKYGVLCGAFSPNGSRIITGSEDNTARIWDVKTGKIISTLIGHTASVTAVAFSRDGQRVITGSDDYSAKLWDPSPDREGKGKPILNLKGHTQEVTSVRFSHDGRYVATGSRDGTAMVWLTTNWQAPKLAAGQPRADR